MSWYGFCHFLFARPVRFFRNARIEGAENIDVEKTYLICSNHLAADDPILIGAVLKRKLRYMAKKELISIPIAGLFLRSLGAYPIDRNGKDIGAVRKTISFLESGESVLMFPQGTRMPGMPPSSTQPKPGCAMIAEKSGVDVLPVLIETKNWKMKPFRRTTVRIGKPVSYSAITEANRDSYGKGAALIFKKITEMENTQEENR